MPEKAQIPFGEHGMEKWLIKLENVKKLNIYNSAL